MPGENLHHEVEEVLGFIFGFFLFVFFKVVSHFVYADADFNSCVMLTAMHYCRMCVRVTSSLSFSSRPDVLETGVFQV